MSSPPSSERCSRAGNAGDGSASRSKTALWDIKRASLSVRWRTRPAICFGRASGAVRRSRGGLHVSGDWRQCEPCLRVALPLRRTHADAPARRCQLSEPQQRTVCDADRVDGLLWIVTHEGRQRPENLPCAPVINPVLAGQTRVSARSRGSTCRQECPGDPPGLNGLTYNASAGTQRAAHPTLPLLALSGLAYTKGARCGLRVDRR